VGAAILGLILALGIAAERAETHRQLRAHEAGMRELDRDIKELQDQTARKKELLHGGSQHP
jgi:hypothetical protein